MKHADLEKIRAAGLITDEQCQKIIEHFHLGSEDGGGKLLQIISIIGAVMSVSGIVLLVAANWNDIPRGIKIATGLLLLVGCYGGGYYFRDVKTEYKNTGEALYLAGAMLFLANIGLIGQIYNLSSRPPNAILLWWVGFAVLPWLLRSKPLHILSLIVFTVWIIWEANLEDSLLHIGQLHQFETCVFTLLGLVFLGAGYCLRRTSFHGFADPTEHFGLLGICGFSYPLVWKYFYDPVSLRNQPHCSIVILLVLGALAIGMITTGLWKENRLTPQWRVTWGAALAAVALVMILLPFGYNLLIINQTPFCHFPIAVMLFVFCMLQIQVGVHLHSPSMVNLGIALIALILVALYISLIDTMERTGWLFLISGVFLVIFGIYLEKKRRTLLLRMRETNIAPATAAT